MTSTII